MFDSLEECVDYIRNNYDHYLERGNDTDFYTVDPDDMNYEPDELNYEPGAETNCACIRYGIHFDTEEDGNRFETAFDQLKLKGSYR